MKTYLSLFLFFISFQALAQARTIEPNPRKSINLNNNWIFAKEKTGSQLNFTKVNLPHTWNAFDTMDDEPGYYRGIGVYKKKLTLDPAWKTKQLLLHFEGSNQETTIYVNGKKVGSHIGGYTAFTIPLKNLKFNGTDELTVKVDNSFNENIAPLTGDFTFFGGLYRNVSLLVVAPIHFSDNQQASKGVWVSAANVNETNAVINVNGKLSNTLSKPTQLTIATILTDAKGKKISEVKTSLMANANQDLTFNLPDLTVAKPNLWSPKNPYLYVATTRMIDSKTGKILDELKTNVGLRFFSFDAEKGFFLNGAPLKLIGASRHQDFAGMGNAVPSSLQVRDVQLLKEMGGNFLRVAHYPQDQAVLDACDRMGILASVEIPVVNEITESEAFERNCISMQLEMIKQNYNHPSVIIWAYMNEVLLKMRHQKDPERKKLYLKNIAALAQKLEDLTRTTDPTRYTMMSNHGDVTGYTNAGLVQIPMLVGWNLYQGWYGGKSEDFGPNLDKIHLQLPDKPMLVTEFGADADPRIHATTPIRFDKSLEYAMNYHQVYIKDILKRPFVAGAAVWNLSDFASETREETMPHVNNKGLLTLDRKPKNTYYLYKANFSEQPFIKIGDGCWKLRSGIATSFNTSNQNLQVISNADSVTVYLNGKSLGKQKVTEKLSNWDVPFKNGINQLKAIANVNGKQIEDVAKINFILQSATLKNTSTPFKSLNIALGSKREFIDDLKKEIWLPSQNYQKGAWGNIGGEAFKVKSNQQSYGTSKNIRGTTNDPIYQTQLVGLDAYQLDVPMGKYEVTLHFAELMGNGIQSVLPYNLDSLIAVNKEIPEQRIFDVYLNDKIVIKDLNIAATYGVAKSVQKKFDCIVADDKGIKLLFKSKQGKAILNALQVRKID